ncbi:MAG: DUF927 domain-containing protein [Leptospirillum sp.]
MPNINTESEKFLDVEVDPDGKKKQNTDPAPDPGPVLDSLQPAELSAIHQELFRSSAINPEIASERGYRTVTDAKILIRLGFTPQQRITPTLLIPLHSVTGEVGNIQSRPDAPRFDNVKKKNVRYEAPARSKMLLDIHPRSLPHIGNPSIPLWITEGIRKADSLLSAGAACVIGLVGIWNWRGTNDAGGSTVLPDWESIALKGRTVYIVFDSDIIKPKNHPAEDRLAAFLRSRGADVKIVRIPPGDSGEKVGADDYLAAGKTLADLLSHIRVEATPEKEKPQFDGIPEGFRLNERGVIYVELKEDGNGIPQEIEKWIAGPILVESLARDSHGNTWGRILKFRDPDGHLKKWVMPVELLKGSGEEVRGVLLGLGATLSPIPNRRPLLNQYLQSCRPRARVRCVSKIGWSGDHFVLPEKTFGPESSEGVLFQSEDGPGDLDFSTSGTLENWQREVASLCVGNSRLVFGVSIPFAGPLLEISASDSGGFHFHGPSSTGKTTIQRVAASICGPKDFLKSWRATDNGLEGLLSRRNDATIILDELGQLDPRIAGQSAYLIANGYAKSRAGRSGGLRYTATWRTILLSSGEVTFPTHVAAGGQKTKAGHLVRIIDIPAEVAPGTCFENLHGSASGAEFADRLKTATSMYHGTAFRAYLEALTSKKEIVSEFVRQGRMDFIKTHVPQGAEGQVVRVAERFALVAIAGELATSFGVSGWPPGESEKAAASCFRTWLQARGGVGNRERDQVLSQVRAFFEANGSSRFEPMDAPENMRIIDRVGFRCSEMGLARFYVLPESYKTEIIAGLDQRFATRILIEAGWLEPDHDGKSSQSISLPGIGKKRVYVFSHKVFGEVEL